MCPLSRRAYILDVASEMEQVDGGYTLWFRRVLWDQPLKFENELYVTMHYNQVSARAALRLWNFPGSPGPWRLRLSCFGPRGVCSLHGLCFSESSGEAVQVAPLQEAPPSSFLWLPSRAEHLACPSLKGLAWPCHFHGAAPPL